MSQAIASSTLKHRAADGALTQSPRCQSCRYRSTISSGSTHLSPVTATPRRLDSLCAMPTIFSSSILTSRQMASDQLCQPGRRRDRAGLPVPGRVQTCGADRSLCLSPGTRRQADGSWIIHATRIPAAISINGRALTLTQASALRTALMFARRDFESALAVT